MSDLSSKFTGLEDQLTTEQTAKMGALETIQSQLTDVFNTLDTINNNAALNTQLLLKAIGAQSTCNPCPTPPLLGQPPVDTTQPINGDKCKRAQAFLHVISLFCDFADAMHTLANAFTTAFVIGVMDQVRSDTGDTGIPNPGWIDTVNLAGDGLSYVIGRDLDGVSTHDVFDSISSGLLSTLYAAASPSAAKSAFDSAVDSASGSTGAKVLLKAMAYQDLVNWYFDTANTPVTTGYSSSACSGFSTVCANSVGTPFNVTSSNHQADWTGTVLEANTAGVEGWGPYHVRLDQALGDYECTFVAGDTIELVSFLKAGGGVVVHNPPFTFTMDADRWLYMQSAANFEVRVCFTPAG